MTRNLRKSGVSLLGWYLGLALSSMMLQPKMAMIVLMHTYKFSKISQCLFLFKDTCIIMLFTIAMIRTLHQKYTR